jgi:hypothetical protein
MFGRLWTGTFRRSMIDLARRIYEGDPGIVPAPPPGEYRFRVMGNLFRGRIAVGGHLYAGAERWVFVPHRKNLRRHQAPVEIVPSEVEVVPGPMQGLSKLLTSRPSFAVRIGDPAAAVVLKTPDPNQVASKLREIVADRASSNRTAR